MILPCCLATTKKTLWAPRLLRSLFRIKVFWKHAPSIVPLVRGCWMTQRKHSGGTNLTRKMSGGLCFASHFKYAAYFGKRAAGVSHMHTLQGFRPENVSLHDGQYLITFLCSIRMFNYRVRRRLKQRCKMFFQISNESLWLSKVCNLGRSVAVVAGDPI